MLPRQQGSEACQRSGHGGRICLRDLPRCAGFHQTSFPTLKQKYGNADRVRFSLQEIHLVSLASAPFALARCERPSPFLDAVDLLFCTRKAWLYAEKPAETSVHMLWVASLCQDTFAAAIRDETIHRQMVQRLEIGRSLGSTSLKSYL